MSEITQYYHGSNFLGQKCRHATGRIRSSLNLHPGPPSHADEAQGLTSMSCQELLPFRHIHAPHPLVRTAWGIPWALGLEEEAP